MRVLLAGLEGETEAVRRGEGETLGVRARGELDTETRVGVTEELAEGELVPLEELVPVLLDDPLAVPPSSRGALGKPLSALVKLDKVGGEGGEWVRVSNEEEVVVHNALRRRAFRTQWRDYGRCSPPPTQTLALTRMWQQAVRGGRASAC